MERASTYRLFGVSLDGVRKEYFRTQKGVLILEWGLPNEKNKGVIMTTSEQIRNRMAELHARYISSVESFGVASEEARRNREVYEIFSKKNWEETR